MIKSTHPIHKSCDVCNTNLDCAKDYYELSVIKHLLMDNQYQADVHIDNINLCYSCYKSLKQIITGIDGL